MEPHRTAVQQPEGGDEEAVVSREAAAWRRRPFARTFDLIASQYGWTDEEILDLTMARMRQVREVIWERQAEDRRNDLTVREIELRTLAGYIAGAAGDKQGVKNAAKIRLVPPDPAAPRQIRPIPFERAQRLFGG